MASLKGLRVSSDLGSKLSASEQMSVRNSK